MVARRVWRLVCCPLTSETTHVSTFACLPAAQISDYLAWLDSQSGSKLAVLVLRAKFSLTELGTRVPLMIKVPWLTHTAGRRTVRCSMHRCKNTTYAAAAAAVCFLSQF